MRYVYPESDDVISGERTCLFSVLRINAEPPMIPQLVADAEAKYAAAKENGVPAAERCIQTEMGAR